MIIFDLDDTLIDTSGVVTPFKMKECFRRLIALGVKCPLSSFNELIENNKKSSKSKDAIIAFAKKYFASDEQIEQALQVLTAPLPDSFHIPMTTHAQEILEYYRGRYPMAIVTGGHPPYQMDKLEKAGIERAFFSMIAIPEDSVKKPCYREIQKEFNIPSNEIWVCGDRIEVDLRPAFELGMNTIHMKWGRGASLEEKWVNYSINNLHALKDIIR
ncbi:MAG TPA: HAD family hydrolase [Chlamydiales bacterium]|nr:HAD family hydrolase [Chlamydiales bacterium]